MSTTLAPKPFERRTLARRSRRSRRAIALRTPERSPAAAAATQAEAAASQPLAVWFEVLVVAWLLVAYDAINNLAPLSAAAALARAQSVLAVERSLHIDVELTLNRWLAHHALIGYIASTYYDLGHFLVTFGVLGLLLWKRRALFGALRTQLVLINVIAFVVFWRFPVAPPRMLAADGFQDIVARTDALVSWHSGGLARSANQYAAFPSLHVAWAMWSALALWRMFPRRAVRALAVAMAALTMFVVLATGNHFVLDILAGAATFLLAGLAVAPTRRIAVVVRDLRRRGRAPERLVAAPGTPLSVTLADAAEGATR